MKTVFFLDYAQLANCLALSASSLADWFFPLLSPASSTSAILVSVSCPNLLQRASTLALYAVFSHSGSLTKYIPAPPVNERNRSEAFSSSLHCPSEAYSSNWLTQPTKSTLPSYFFGPEAEFLQLNPSLLLAVPYMGFGPCPKGDVAKVDARKSNLMVASNFSLKCTLESIEVAIIVPVQHRFNTATTSVTTVPV